MMGRIYRYSIKVAAVLAVMVFCSVSFAFAEGKIGYVDLRKAF